MKQEFSQVSEFFLNQLSSEPSKLKNLFEKLIIIYIARHVIYVLV